MRCNRRFITPSLFTGLVPILVIIYITLWRVFRGSVKRILAAHRRHGAPQLGGEGTSVPSLPRGLGGTPGQGGERGEQRPRQILKVLLWRWLNWEMLKNWILMDFFWDWQTWRKKIMVEMISSRITWGNSPLLVVVIQPFWGLHPTDGCKPRAYTKVAIRPYVEKVTSPLTIDHEAHPLRLQVDSISHCIPMNSHCVSIHSHYI